MLCTVSGAFIDWIHTGPWCFLCPVAIASANLINTAMHLASLRRILKKLNFLFINEKTNTVK